jgi:hypothetical protein
MQMLDVPVRFEQSRKLRDKPMQLGAGGQRFKRLRVHKFDFLEVAATRQRVDELKLPNHPNFRNGTANSTSMICS